MRTGNLVHGLIGGAVLAFSLAVPTLAQAAGAPIPVAARPQSMPREPACNPDSLSLATDDLAGDFNGMSQSGTLLVLRNLSQDTCTVPDMPEVSFLDANGKVLPSTLWRYLSDASSEPVVRPVARPVALPGWAEVTSRLNWVSGEGAFPNDVCIHPSAIQVRIGAKTLRAPLQTVVCGPNGGPAIFEALPFLRDPVYVPTQR